MPMKEFVPEIEGLSITVVGAFNPAIFHPEWFLRYKVLSEEEITGSTPTFVTGDISQIQFGTVDFVCVKNTMTVRTLKLAYFEKVVDFVASVFTLLSHTPIQAAGINAEAHYKIESTDYWHKIGHTLAPKNGIWDELYQKPGMQNLMIRSPREGKFGGFTMITVEPSAFVNPGLYVASNCHCDIPNTAGNVTSEILREFLQLEWNSAKVEARRVANKLFEKITPDAH
jgi:hypothetical protein